MPDAVPRSTSPFRPAARLSADSQCIRVYWAAFARQNHAVPVAEPRPARTDPGEGHAPAGLCGVLAAPAVLAAWDHTLPVCAWCSAEVRTGSYHLATPPAELSTGPAR